LRNKVITDPEEIRDKFKCTTDGSGVKAADSVLTTAKCIVVLVYITYCDHVCVCVQIPESLLAKSYADVAAYLTKDARNDLEKIRAIFRWTASLDLAALQGRTTELPEPGTPLDYLLRINWRMGNHANFIMHMARYVRYMYVRNAVFVDPV